MPKPTTIREVVENRLCLGCGACASVSENDSITMVNVREEGLRPWIKSATQSEVSSKCSSVCPAIETDLREGRNRPGIIKELFDSFGPVLEIWEGHACDDQIRKQGSSGGALTALSLFCMEEKAMTGTLHIGQDPQTPLANKTRLSKNRAQLLSCTGSRYAPASACDSLDLIENAPNPCVFIGQPSEIAAYRKAQAMNPKLSANTGLVLSFFCAGTPSQNGTRQLLKDYSVEEKELAELRYRGHGWPGYFSTRLTKDEHFTAHLPYRETWQFLRNYRPLSTYLFPDSSGEGSDISCGDPWYHDIKTSDSGSSLIVVRTELGRQILREAAAAGFLSLKRREAKHLVQSQGSLVKKRGEAWGRLLACKLMFMKTPDYRGFSMFKNWRRLGIKQATRCVLSTFKRARKHKYYRKLKFNPETGERLN